MDTFEKMMPEEGEGYIFNYLFEKQTQRLWEMSDFWFTLHMPDPVSEHLGSGVSSACRVSTAALA